MLLNLTIVAGDGIGPEVTEEAVRVLETVATCFGHELKLTRKNIGGAALTASNDPLPAGYAGGLPECGGGAAGGGGCLRLMTRTPGICGRRQDCFACARNWERMRICGRRNAFPRLLDNSPLRPEVVRGTDIMIVRELLGGSLFRTTAVDRRRAGLAIGGEHDALRRTGDRTHSAGGV